MLARSSLIIFLATFVLRVLSENTTSKIKIRYYVTENNQGAIVEINSVNKLETESNASQIVVIHVLEGSLPIIYANDFKGFPLLRNLELPGCEIEEIQPGAFGDNALVSIGLPRNKITTIEDGVFSNLTVQYLDLGRNLIETISPHAFDNMPQLKSLDLNNNKIQIVHREWFKWNPQLSINLAYNQIEHLPNEVFYIQNVSRIDNDLIFEHLVLAGNKIKEWKADFLKGARVRSLDMSTNKLQCLEGNYANLFTALLTDIDDNPWDCECLLKIAKWAVENQRDSRIRMTNSVEICNSTGQFPTMRTLP